MAVTIRAARDDDAVGIVRLGQENSAYYVMLSPELFRIPDEEGLVELIERDREWRDGPDTLALVAADGQGIATRLVLAAEEWGRDKSAVVASARRSSIVRCLFRSGSGG